MKELLNEKGLLKREKLLPPKFASDWGKNLPQREKFAILHEYQAGPALEDVLREKLDNLYIEIGGGDKGKVFNLMKRGKLEGWCWQTTQSVAPFMDDDAHIERGNLFLDEHQHDYFHSWLTLNFDNLDFVFDPALSVLALKELYYTLFQVEKMGETSAKNVKEALFSSIQNTPKPDEKYLQERCWSKALREQALEIKVKRKNDVNAPFFRGDVGYRRPKVEGNKIKELTAHYYYNG